MRERIRLVVSDIDGTLVRQDKSLSDGVVAAVQRLQNAGVAFSLISARPPSGMLWIAAKLGLTGNLESLLRRNPSDFSRILASAIYSRDSV
jgi:HAD superfamily hydrolase (TIGR01484 family)